MLCGRASGWEKKFYNFITLISDARAVYSTCRLIVFTWDTGRHCQWWWWWCGDVAYGIMSEQHVRSLLIKQAISLGGMSKKKTSSTNRCTNTKPNFNYSSRTSRASWWGWAPRVLAHFFPSRCFLSCKVFFSLLAAIVAYRKAHGHQVLLLGLAPIGIWHTTNSSGWFRIATNGFISIQQ